MRGKLERFLVAGALGGTLVASIAAPDDQAILYALLGATLGGFIFVMAYR